MKRYTAEINTHALDVALEALFKTTGRDEAKRVYELLNASMVAVYEEGAAVASAAKVEYFNTQIDQINAGWKAKADEAQQIGYEAGQAEALFKQELAKLSAGRRSIPRVVDAEETALVNSVSALG